MTGPVLVAVLLAAAPSQEPKAAAQATPAAVASLYDQARALYAEGPSRAPEIIDLLKRHLQAEPTHEKAISLLAITYFGTEQFEKALATFEEGLAITEKRGEINPGLVLYKARTLLQLGRCPEAKKILDAYRAFWQDDTGDAKRRYDAVAGAVAQTCGTAP